MEFFISHQTKSNEYIERSYSISIIIYSLKFKI